MYLSLFTLKKKRAFSQHIFKILHVDFKNPYESQNSKKNKAQKKKTNTISHDYEIQPTS